MIHAITDQVAEGVEVRVAIITGVFALLVAGISGWFSYQAARNSRPVANGFTQHVRDELKYLREQHDLHMQFHLNR